jgi:acetylglutamate kinase
MRTVSYTEIDYYELEALIAEVADMSITDVNIIAIEECNNDSSYTFKGMTGELDKWESELISRTLTEKRLPMYSTFAWIQYLVSLGKLPKGDYLLMVSW